MPEVPLLDAFEWTRYRGAGHRCPRPRGCADHCLHTRAPVLGAGPLTPGDGWHRVAFAWQSRLIRSSVCGRCTARASWACGGTSRFRRRGRGLELGDIVQATMQGWRLHTSGRLRGPSCWPRADWELAAVHAGWRATAAGAARSAVEALGERSARPGGPGRRHRASIGPCATASGRTCGRVRGGRHAGSFARRLVQPGAERRGPSRCAGKGNPAAAGGGPLCSSHVAGQRGPVRAAGNPHRADPRLRGCAPPATATCFHAYRWTGKRAGRMIGVSGPRGISRTTRRTQVVG